MTRSRPPAALRTKRRPRAGSLALSQRSAVNSTRAPFASRFRQFWLMIVYVASGASSYLATLDSAPAASYSSA
ncbi:hypothetical protein D3C85_1333610 [compost metagenome]